MSWRKFKNVNLPKDVCPYPVAVTSVKLMKLPCHKQAGRTFLVIVALLSNFINAISLYNWFALYSGCPIISSTPKSCGKMNVSVFFRSLSPTLIKSGGVLMSYKFEKNLIFLSSFFSIQNYRPITQCAAVKT